MFRWYRLAVCMGPHARLAPFRMASLPPQRPSASPRPSGPARPEPIAQGTVVNERYEVRHSLGTGGMGEVFLAYDRSTQQDVALKVVRAEARMPGDDEALRQELLLARQVSHPNVCRVHDLAPSPWGPILVMEQVQGTTLHTHIRQRKARGGYTPDEFRRIAAQIASGLAAIHEQGLVHGDFKPGNVMVTQDARAVILDFGFAQERARVAARQPGAPPDGGTPNYMSPERMQNGGASVLDDIYALGLTLWEMWTCKVPEPGARPRTKTMREQIMFDVPAGLSIDEIREVFVGMSEDAAMRPHARHLRFFNPAQVTASSFSLPRERLDPGPPPGRAGAAGFVPNAQGLLITYASNALESVGTFIPLSQATMTVGRRPDQDIVLAEPTVSGAHAVLNWSQGAWRIDDVGSTNGSYAEHSYDRKTQLSLLHGGEVQLGECRLRLVSFSAGTRQHENAKRYLKRRDGLTGMFDESELLRHLREDCTFAWWADIPMFLARYELKAANRPSSDRPTILEMLALRRVAQRVVEMTETLLVRITPAVAGRHAPLRFSVSMVGCSLSESRHVVEQIVAQVQGLLPPSHELVAAVVAGEHGTSAARLLEG